MDWLIRDWQFFGLHGQVWMLVFAAGLALYIAVLILARRYNTHSH
jgi:succinyl-CoA synthetase beta subunit